ncbi:MAG: GNAT family N-acetyltransferase [Candidatus Zixiibacteriota bacterium]
MSSIVLRKLQKADAENLRVLLKDGTISRFTFVPHPYYRRHAEVFIRQTQTWARLRRGYHFGIELNETRRIIGVVAIFRIDTIHRSAELGCWLGQPYWRQGLMTEAMKTVIRFGFRELHLERIYAHVFVENVASQRMVERCGLQCEGLLRHRHRRRGRWHDSFLYAILRGEFRMRQHAVST